MIYSDINLSQKLERTESRANTDMIESRAKISPEVNAEWIEVGGTYAMFDGVESPLTQTFGLGIFEETTDKELDQIELFYQNHNAPVFHEVSPMADIALIALLNKRNYQPIEMVNVMFQSLELEKDSSKVINPQIKTRIIEKNEDELWAKTASAGWATEAEELADFMFHFGKVCANCKGGFPFLAEINGEVISNGMLFIYDDVALLAGASTIPEGRRQGGQQALLQARLNFAKSHGCKIAMMCALPGTQSQKNAQKNGFQIAYTRTKWQLKDENSTLKI